MLCQLGSIVTSVTGRLGGQLYSSGKFGSVAKNRRLKSKVSSKNQALFNQMCGQIRSGWRTISVINKSKWSRFASYYQNTFSNSSEKKMSGYNFFYKSNFYRRYLNLALLQEPVNSFIPKPLNVTSFTYQVTANRLYITFSPALQAGCAIFVYMSRPTAKHITSAPNNYKYITRNIPGANQYILITGNYSSVFGTYGSVGQKIFARLVVVNPLNGLASTPVFVSAISSS